MGLLGGAAAIKNIHALVLGRRPGQLNGLWQFGNSGMPASVQDIAGGFGNGPSGEVGLKMSLKRSTLCRCTNTPLNFLQ